MRNTDNPLATGMSLVVGWTWGKKVGPEALAKLNEMMWADCKWTSYRTKGPDGRTVLHLASDPEDAFARHRIHFPDTPLGEITIVPDDSRTVAPDLCGKSECNK